MIYKYTLKYESSGNHPLYSKGEATSLFCYEYLGGAVSSPLSWDIHFAGEPFTCARDMCDKVKAAFCNAIRNRLTYFYVCEF